MLNVITTKIPDVLILEPQVFGDSRGYFTETYNQDAFDKALEEAGATPRNSVGSLRPVRFVQDNQSKSKRGVMRGFHFQAPPFAQAKLVRCVVGAVMDVAIDIRVGSPTFGEHVAVELSENNFRQLFIPRGFLHGFVVLSDEAIFQYKCDNLYAPQADGGVSILDTSFGIDWPINPSDAIISEKDTHHPMFKEFVSPFRYGE